MRRHPASVMTPRPPRESRTNRIVLRDRRGMALAGYGLRPDAVPPYLRGMTVISRKAEATQAGDDSPRCPDDYAVYLFVSRTAEGRYLGKVEVIRKMDGKKIYPIEGALEIGPFDTAAEARQTAINLGGMVIDTDLKRSRSG